MSDQLLTGIDEENINKIARRPSFTLPFPRCRACGVPRLLTLMFTWTDGGAITMRMFDKRYRFAFVEHELIETLIGLLEEEFGKERVRAILYAVEKSASEQFARTIYFIRDGAPAWMRALSRVLRSEHVSTRMVESMTTLLGVGATDTMFTRNRQAGGHTYFVASIRRPHDKTLMLADTDGIVGLVRGRPLRHRSITLSREQEHYIYYGDCEGPLEVEEGESFPLPFRRLQSAPGKLTFSRCPRCGAPEPIRHLYWDARTGCIIHRVTGRRHIFWPCYSLENLIVSVSEELGEGARDLIFNTIKDYQVRSIREDGIGFTAEEAVEFISAGMEDQCRMLLDRLAYLGFGYAVPSFSEENGVSIRIVNPLAPQITSGLFAGIMETLSGRPVDVSREETAGEAVYAIKPR